MGRTIKDLIDREGPSFGAYVSDTGETVCEIAAMAGYDFFRMDYEHTLVGYGQLKEMVRIADGANIPIVFRVNTPAEITRALDFGVTGILIPDIETAEQAREAVKLCKYAPIGARGMTNMSRCFQYGGLPYAEYVKAANDRITVCLQIESKTGVDNLEQILAVEGVDLITTGKLDLSQSMGYVGNPGSEAVTEAENRIIETCLNAGMPLMMTAGTPEKAMELYNRGIKLLNICFDGPFISKAYRSHLASFKTAFRQ